ncbi:MAG: cytochrome b/b6 domain-containing protein [Betaproteobacteria bacterium]|nr:cytochrome b/b6 domain-containing protein [Betaproteobacteria bacterium]
MSSTSLPGPAAMAPAGNPVPAKRSRRIVDAPTRVFHALFALCFLGAYLTAEGEAMRLLHVTLGYSMAGLLVFRLVYGLVGPRHARLSLLAGKLRSLPQWLASVVLGTADRTWAAVNWRQGQNLALAVAVVALMVLVVPLTLSGYATYNEWGDWLGDVHELAGNAFLVVVLVHVGIVLLLSLLRRKNMAMQMVHGRGQGPGPDLVKRNHAWLAVLILVAVLGYWSWEWHQSPNGLISAQTVTDLLSGRESGDSD